MDSDLEKRFEERQKVLQEKLMKKEIAERKYGKIKRDANGKIIRGYVGIDMKEVYRKKPLLYKVAKRLFDIVVSAFGLVVLFPVFVLVSIAIKLEDGGPVIFSGQRWGKDFRYFPMYKFRSMVADAEQRTDEVVSEEDKNGMAFKIKDDPRMTKVGQFLRRTSIDELPQMLNVLKGEMSLVGPRPIQTTTENGDPYDMQRWCVKPGITCFWQVCGRTEVSWDEWVEMDLYYIEQMGMGLDLKLILQTFGAVFGKKGAM